MFAEGLTSHHVFFFPPRCLFYALALNYYDYLSVEHRVAGLSVSLTVKKIADTI